MCDRDHKEGREVKWLVTIAVLTLLCGCLSVVRIPLCNE